MKNYRPRRPRSLLALAAFVFAAMALSFFVLLPLAVESHVPEFGAGAVAVAVANH